MEKKENRNSYSELSKGEESSPTKTLKKGKENREVRILRRFKSAKEKADPSRFSGEGINFRAKIIGIEDVFDARGNRMCQEALQKLKAAVKTSGDHKQKIILNISLNGIIIKDEKLGEVLHHHPIHKISCISQDSKDNRAFGFVYGCPKTGHRFFAIKTDKAASQVVMTLRDLFLVALEIKEKEIESAVEKEGAEAEKDNEHTTKSVNGFSNGIEPDFEKQEVQRSNNELLYSNTVLLPEEETASETALLDLQSEVSILHQGISQMDESIAHAVSQSLGISFSEDEISEASTSSIPTSFQLKMEKLASLYHETMSISSRSSSTSDYNINAPENKPEDNDTPKKDLFRSSSSAVSDSLSLGGTASETANAVDQDKYAVFLEIDSLPSIFDNPIPIQLPIEKFDTLLPQNSIHETEEERKSTSASVAFAELDPLGNQPFVDKRDFFQDIKTPPKKILKDLANTFEGSDSEVVADSDEYLAVSDLKSNLLEASSVAEGILTNPPKLPPKRHVTASHFPISSELFQESSDNGSWEPKNPFNPFLDERYPDLPPPTSPPPPPPPPRFCNKTPESSPSMSSHPPDFVNGIPTPPLPKRKVPLNSASRTWFSFDQEAVSLTSDFDSGTHQPPLPSPARKLPPLKPESSLLKSSSASSSPATRRRNYNRSPCLDTNLSPIIKENSDDYCPYLENDLLKENRESKMNSLTHSPHKMLSSHSSIAQDGRSTFSGATFNPFRNCETNPESPPLPPKPVSFSKPKPFQKVDGTSSSSNVSATESSNGAHSSSSLVFSSLDDSKMGSSSEALFTNSTSSQSDVFTQSSQETVRLSEGKADISPDSIFRRKGDPFADDFFLSLHKKPGGDISNSSSLIDPFANTKAPT